MLKAAFVILIVAGVCFCANGQSKGDTLFTITYNPSFHNQSRLTVYKQNSGVKGVFQTISVLDGKPKIDTATSTLSSEAYDSYVKFFSTYKFPGYIDNKFPDTSKNYKQGLDGITIIGVYYGISKKLFRFWSPYDDRESMALFKMTLNDLDRFFKTKDNKKYLKWLRKYSR